MHFIIPFTISALALATHIMASYTVNNAFGTRFGVALDGNACGISGANPAVAVNPSWFNTANPNHASICGKTVAITNSKGKTIRAKVVDKCVACGADNHLDMTNGLFYGLGGKDQTGHVSNIKYTIENWNHGNSFVMSNNTAVKSGRKGKNSKKAKNGTQ
ncbi:hypothetical protein BC936DRAFT_145372 [Jimgerdemannia flammicorona]|uniref:RlpA-like double-psi beta-barrel-protein domain-containing protein-containing protein n=1 Tax=Jimgerdemannia flammicorona TaxID=994334 RepID=A0A433DA67_9FUNG|nr:hypothetical protein BC936DRAFT_145372 [Jimgerdemannia flammicorona]